MTAEKADFKDSLNLPKTDFPMKASLAQREPERVAAWEADNTYQYVQEQRQGNAVFLLHDGPPYANGHLHLGHVLNKVLKDIVVKYKRSRGFSVPYVPGWDCHGLPIELKSIEESGLAEPASVRTHCRRYAERFINIQRDEFRRLGILGDWNDPYLTMHPAYEGAILSGLAGLVEKGFVERGNKPVHWCVSCETALAEAEVEYAEHRSHSLYVRFPVAASAAELPERTHLLIWTTTPWTLPANLAVAIAPDASYGVYRDGAGAVIIAESLVEETFAVFGHPAPDPLVRYKGSELAGTTYRHPFLERTGTVYVADFVALDTGTGMVHIAPGHGEDDYRLGLATGLDVYAPVDGKGRFVGVADWLDGIVVWKGNALVLERLAADGLLWHQDKLEHSYPHCWRCQQPIIFRATPQWFVRMASHDLRGTAMREIESVHWLPSWGRERIEAMMQGRPDWCISRQRVWGVPITSLHCRQCGEVYLDAPFMHRVAQQFSSATSDIWFTDARRALLADAPPCPACGGTDIAGGDEILDVWFDSGISWHAAVAGDSRMGSEIDLYLEGSDQHRGWFQSSLLLSCALQGKAPFKNVLTHGFVVDGNGHKMSKSRGNVIAPQKIWDASGAEILRIWCAAEDYRMDIRVSDQILSHGADAYRRIRNTIRFLLGNLSDFTPSTHAPAPLAVEWSKLEPLDQFALHRYSELVKKVQKGYEEYQFHLAFQSLHNWCTLDLSGFYLDIIKDRLYVHGADSPTRRAAQTVMAQMLEGLLIMSAPILSFTAEEGWGYMPWRNHPTVFAALWPEPAQEWSLLPDVEADWSVRQSVRKTVLGKLEEKRQSKEIGQSLAAAVEIHCTPDEAKLLQPDGEFLRKFLIVSKAVVIPDLPAAGGSDWPIVVKHAAGEKCGRCWHFEIDLDEQGLCPRCVTVLQSGGKK